MSVQTLLRHLFSDSFLTNATGGICPFNINSNILPTFQPVGMTVDTSSLLLSDAEYIDLFSRLALGFDSIETISRWLADFLRLEFNICKILAGTLPASFPASSLLLPSLPSSSSSVVGTSIGWNNEKQLILSRRYLCHLCFQVISLLSSQATVIEQVNANVNVKSSPVLTLLNDCKEAYHALYKDLAKTDVNYLHLESVNTFY